MSGEKAAKDVSGGGGSKTQVTRVGKYILIDTLGEGAFGKVKLAIDEKTGHEYAVKIMDKSHIQANELTVQVRREIAVMKALRHPNIVNLHEVLNSSKNLYMVMDYVTGGELFDVVQEHGRLPENKARSYFQQLVDGIEYCHSRRVYHRDLKPENLLVSDDKKTLKITDFGLSSIKQRDTSSELLHTIMGSPHYIAPEIITSAANGYEGDKVDTWATGIILYGMLSGYLPFDEQSTQDLYRAIVHNPVEFPPHFSYDVSKLLRAMLHKDPMKRVNMEQIKTFAWFKVDYEPQEILHPITADDTVKKKSRRKRTEERRNQREPRERQAIVAAAQVPDDEPAFDFFTEDRDRVVHDAVPHPGSDKQTRRKFGRIGHRKHSREGSDLSARRLFGSRDSDSKPSDSEEYEVTKGFRDRKPSKNFRKSLLGKASIALTPDKSPRDQPYEAATSHESLDRIGSRKNSTGSVRTSSNSGSQQNSPAVPRRVLRQSLQDLRKDKSGASRYTNVSQPQNYKSHPFRRAPTKALSASKSSRAFSDKSEPLEGKFTHVSSDSSAMGRFSNGSDREIIQNRTMSHDDDDIVPMSLNFIYDTSKSPRGRKNSESELGRSSGELRKAFRDRSSTESGNSTPRRTITSSSSSSLSKIRSISSEKRRKTPDEQEATNVKMAAPTSTIVELTSPVSPPNDSLLAKRSSFESLRDQTKSGAFRRTEGTNTAGVTEKARGMPEISAAKNKVSVSESRVSPNRNQNIELQRHNEQKLSVPTEQVPRKENRDQVTETSKTRNQNPVTGSIFKPITIQFDASCLNKTKSDGLSPDVLCPPRYTDDDDEYPNWCLDSADVFADIEGDDGDPPSSQLKSSVSVVESLLVMPQPQFLPAKEDSKSIFSPLNVKLRKKLSKNEDISTSVTRDHSQKIVVASALTDHLDTSF